MRIFAAKLVALGLAQNYVVGWVLHYVFLPSVHREHVAEAASDPVGHGAHLAQMAGMAGMATGSAESTVDPLAQFLRDSTLALPATFAVLLLVVLAGELVSERFGFAVQTFRARIAFAVAAAAAFGLAAVPKAVVYDQLFGSRAFDGLPTSDLTGLALITLRSTFALVLVAVALLGVPWRSARPVVELQNAQ
jgi:ABC-type dipeptide/oligopeptide/nickel transport system permease subunit